MVRFQHPLLTIERWRMIYASVGDEKTPLALPKLVQFQVEEYGKVSNRTEMFWTVKSACTLTHVYLLDCDNNIFMRHRLNRTMDVSKRETFSFPVGGLKWSLHNVDEPRPSKPDWKLI